MSGLDDYLVQHGHMSPPSDESTSAALRRVAAERDELRETVRMLQHSESLDIFAAEAERDLARAELATARQELDQRRSWVVARDGGRDCGTCGQEIRRGEAYEITGPDDLRHIHCPDRKETA